MVNGNACEDIDECDQGLDNCAAEATCSDLAGTYACSCGVGYYGGASGLTCHPCDCNGRDASPHGCDPTTGECDCGVGEDLQGARCDTCVAGKYAVGDTTCSSCSDNCNGHTATCDATTGACGDCGGNTGNARCEQCLPGFRNFQNGLDSTDGKVCTPYCTGCLYGECEYDASVSDSVCNCQSGYSGELCNKDIDECTASSQNPCEIDALCVNTVGAYFCECKCGYESSSGRLLDLQLVLGLV